MKEVLSDKQVLYFCGLHSHRGSLANSGKKIPGMDDTKDFLNSMPDEITEKEIKAVAEYLYLNPVRFIKKYEQWKTMNKNKQWCVHCGMKPVKKGNRLFCSDCHKRASTRSTFDNVGSGGSGFRVARTGGTGKSYD